MTVPRDGTPAPPNSSAGLRIEPLDDARFVPGRIFADRYRIVSLLGRGAMGEVYCADDLRLGHWTCRGDSWGIKIPSSKL